MVDADPWVWVCFWFPTSSSKAEPARFPRQPLLLVTVVHSPNSLCVQSEAHKPAPG